MFKEYKLVMHINLLNNEKTKRLYIIKGDKSAIYSNFQNTEKRLSMTNEESLL